jgi:hypothetical protein
MSHLKTKSPKFISEITKRKMKFTSENAAKDLPISSMPVLKIIEIKSPTPIIKKKINANVRRTIGIFYE